MALVVKFIATTKIECKREEKNQIPERIQRDNK
jgi:hypothetical protein